MKEPRITMLAGHYGSGKTQIAINMALDLKKRRERVALVDLDIVNPYFRSGDHIGVLCEAGVRLIISPFAGSNVELPGLAPETAAMLDDEGLFCVLDVGGDDRGAVALGRYAAGLRSGAEALLVINKYRPLTAGVNETLEIMREIEAAGKVPFTGIINNSNLGTETTARTVLDSLEYAEEISEASGLPVKLTAARKELVPELRGVNSLYPLTIYEKTAWRM